MKKIISIILSLSLIVSTVSFTACKGNEDSDNGDETKTTTETANQNQSKNDNTNNGNSDKTPSDIFENIANLKDDGGEPLLPIMLDIDESRLLDYNVNVDDAESFVAKEAAISAIFVQIIIIKSKSGKVDTVLKSMTDHQTKLLDDAFYPQGLEAAAASIVGSKGDFVYLICDKNAKIIEDEMLKFIA